VTPDRVAITAHPPRGTGSPDPGRDLTHAAWREYREPRPRHDLGNGLRLTRSTPQTRRA
jgi:hypothetical protein